MTFDDTLPVALRARSHLPDADEPALKRERQRILADLHDGLGASLIGLLHHVQSGNANRASIERRVQEAILDMRITFDWLLRSQHCVTTVPRRPPHGTANTVRELLVANCDQRPLTAREIEVLRALSRGLSYAGIGVRLGVSLGTVTSHIKNVYRKLNVHSAAAAVTRAAALGILR